MSAPAIPLVPSTPQTRVNAIANVVAVNDETKQALLSAATGPSAAGKDITDIISKAVQGLRTAGKINDQIATRLTFANALGALSGDNTGLMKTLDADANVNSIRDFASRISPKEIESMLDTSSASIRDSDPASAKKEVTATISRSLLTVEPTATIRRLVSDDPNLVPDSIIRRYVLIFLDHNPNWDISTTSVEKATKAPDAMEGIPPEDQEKVVEQLQKIQMANAKAPVPEAVSALTSMNMLKASDFTKVSLNTFVNATSGVLDPDVAAETHSNGVSSAMLYEKVMITFMQAIRGTGLRGIDGPDALKDRFVVMSNAARANGLNLDLETLFGSNDKCICDDCTTVYSPASYFVDLLNFLRDTDLETAPSDDPTTKSPALKSSALVMQKTSPVQAPPIKGPVLEKLFRRRPDLGQIELTCENTNVILPYIDLANEVMESFILSLDDFKVDNHIPKQADIDVHNVGTSTTTEELLTAPQNLNLDAYRVLLSSVYPASNLPYHEPMDTIRTYVGQLKLKWHDILQAFRPAMDPNETAAEKALQVIILDRAVAAETLGLVQEEYIILTKEAFWPKQYFDPKNAMPIEEYQEMVGVQPVYKHYGYDCEAEMLDANQSNKSGLMFVKNQLLPRTQISYTTLVQLVETKFINPWWPDGKNRQMLESLRYSYGFLQTLIDPYAKGHKRYAKLVAFLLKAQILPELLEILSGDSPSYQPNGTSNGTSGAQTKRYCCNDDLADWIYDNFDNMGNLIVLDAGQGPQLQCSGDIFLVLANGTSMDPTIKLLPSGAIATLHEDGRITDATGNLTGQVDILGKAMLLSGARHQLWVDQYKGKFASYRIGSSTTPVGRIDSTTSVVTAGPDPAGPVKWILNPLNGGGCNIDGTRLIHLNGTSLTTDEWDRFHRFLRIYKKLGYTVDQVDMAVVNLPNAGPSTPTTAPAALAPATPIVNGTSAVNGTIAPASHAKMTRISIQDFAGQGATTTVPTTTTPPPKAVYADITPYLISELVSFKTLLSTTQLTVEQLLTFWGPIPTAGDSSLYSQLFFRYNILPYDENIAVFSPDANGIYFANGPDSIRAHLPVLMAALNMTAQDITAPQFDTLHDKLDLDSISYIYRYGLLAVVLGIDVADLDEFIKVLQPVSGSPWASASHALSLVQTWNTLKTSGFTFKSLDYIFEDRSDVVNPIKPTEASILETTVALVNGLLSIIAAHPNRDPKNAKAVQDSDMVQANAQLLYSNDVVTQIIALLEGKTTYTTNAPGGLTGIFNIPVSLQARLKYVDNTTTAPAQVSLLGILTAEEITAAKSALDGLPGVPVMRVAKAQADALADQKTAWAQAIDRLGKQAQTFFDTVLSGVFPDTARAELLAGDLPDSSSPTVAAATNGTTGAITKVVAAKQTSSPPAPDGRTAEQKRSVFLDYFIPFLRSQLQRVFVLDTMSGVAGVSDRNLVEVLLDEVIVFDTQQGKLTALNKLMLLQDQPQQDLTKWNGWLQPPADDLYTFYVTSDNKPTSIILNGAECKLPHQSADPSNLWSSDPVKLSAGTLYSFNSNGNNVNLMKWRTARTAISPIPQSVLLPDYTQAEMDGVFDELVRAGLVTNALNLSADEVRYYNTHLGDGTKASSGFGKMTQTQLTKLCAYATLRDSLPPTAPDSLITLFTWCENNPTLGSQLPKMIHRVTGWDPDLIVTIVNGVNYANLDPSYFRDETNIVKLQTLLKAAGQLGVDVQRIFNWTAPVTVANSWNLTQVATDIQKALRSRYDTQTWQKVAQPLNDTLRQNRQAALVSYLLVQDTLIQQGVTDADSLFEFFLIDVQMTSLVQTSRIKQAISTVQLYIQRVLLGLEADKSGVPSDSLSAQRWEWMQKYVLWEANRKVFLYPENYLDPSLRDDKSPFFRELEADLLSKDITKDNMVAALKSYVYKLDQVANLQPLALYKTASGKFYVFSRTYAAPYTYYWRSYDSGSGNWSPWEQMTVDVPDYKVLSQNSTDQGRNGCYLIPFEWQNRMLLFIPQIVKTTVSLPSPQFTKKTENGATTTETETFNDMGSTTTDTKTTQDLWEISMGWTEYRGGKWLPKQLSPSSFTTSSLINIDTFSFLPVVIPSSKITKTVTTLPGSTNNIIITIPETLSITVCVAGQTNSIPVTQFTFNGGEMKLSTTPDPTLNNLPAIPPTRFLEILPTSGGRSVASLQGVLNDTNAFTFPSQTVPQMPEVDFDDLITTLPNIKYINSTTSEPFYHKYASQILSQLLATDDPTDVFTFLSNIQDTDYATAFGRNANGDFHEQNNPYALYNWELGFHAPMLLADRLLKSQKYDDALQMMHYIFNPLGKGVDKDPSKAWVFPPFRLERTQTLEDYFFGLLPGHSNQLVTEWRQNPFDPFVIARGRPVAYMKWAVLKYIDILVEYGDYYFMQNTLETIPMAIQMYVMASHLYGPRGQQIPRQQPTKAQTYMSLRDQWDAFGNAMVQLELTFPYSNQTSLPLSIIPARQAEYMRSMLGNVFGSASTLYFAIPDNSNQRTLGTRIDDRLFKIRHSQDINGVFRQLPNWDPPIDPMLLVQAAAKGVKLSSVLADMSGPMPNYRFTYLLAKAFDMCGQL
jgi:ABC toxin-like protein/neuraminidase-like protein